MGGRNGSSIAVEAGRWPANRQTDASRHARRPSRIGAIIPMTTSMNSLGKYEIERQLGAGYFGVTYLARDVLLDCRVALKVYSLTPGSASMMSEGKCVRSNCSNMRM
jgi:hypothetical protein